MRIPLVLCMVVVMACAISVAQAQEVQKENQEDVETLTVAPKVVRVDSDFNGKIDRFEYYNDEGKVEKVELDRSGDGAIDEWVTYKDGKPLSSERDTNGDGKPDVWLEY
ncbi:MAG: hypothetical protein JW844_07745 [Candidatus Omnitrophica bacterium]|nr:hypothetical protein [Candidatus Omnitrophota bacterium]